MDWWKEEPDAVYVFTVIAFLVGLGIAMVLWG